MKAVMYGGGNIGRGFIGSLFSQSNYRVTFIDVADAVVNHLQEKGCYPIRYVSSNGHEDVLVEKISLRQAITELPERERTVIQLRYFHGLTQERVARVMQVSQVQVSRIEKKALGNLRNLMN